MLLTYVPASSVPFRSRCEQTQHVGCAQLVPWQDQGSLVAVKTVGLAGLGPWTGRGEVRSPQEPSTVSSQQGVAVELRRSLQGMRYPYCLCNQRADLAGRQVDLIWDWQKEQVGKYLEILNYILWMELRTLMISLRTGYHTAEDMFWMWYFADTREI